MHAHCNAVMRFASCHTVDRTVVFGFSAYDATVFIPSSFSSTVMDASSIQRNPFTTSECQKAIIALCTDFLCNLVSARSVLVVVFQVG